jgi:hypothetical protein
MWRRFGLVTIFENYGGFLLALILLLLVFTSFASEAPGKGISHPLALLPSSAEFVLSLDTFALRKSDLVSEMEKRFDSIPEAAENYRRFVQETGIDPRQDTDRVLMSLRQADAGFDSGFLIVAEGRFGASRLVDTAAEKGGTIVTTEDGTRLWTSRGADGGNGSVHALAQPGPDMILFGHESEVRRALDILARRAAPEVKSAKLKDLIAGVDRRAPAWAILNSSALASKLSQEIGRSGADWDPGSAISKVDSVTLMGWVGKDVDVKLRVSTKDGETASLLADVVRGALAAGKLAAKDRDAELLKILQQTSILQEGTTLEMEASIPASRFQLPESAE